MIIFYLHAPLRAVGSPAGLGSGLGHLEIVCSWAPRTRVLVGTSDSSGGAQASMPMSTFALQYATSTLAWYFMLSRSLMCRPSSSRAPASLAARVTCSPSGGRWETTRQLGGDSSIGRRLVNWEATRQLGGRWAAQVIRILRDLEKESEGIVTCSPSRVRA